MRLIAAILACFVLAASGRAGAEPSMIPSHWDQRQRLAKPDLTLPRLRFLTTTDFFPFNFRDAEGRLTGFHLDLARSICRELDLLDRCQIQALPYEELETALEEGEGEALIAGLAVTAEAREKFLFSRPYLEFPARFATRRNASFAEPIHAALSGGRVGVLAGTAHEAMLRDLFPRTRPVTYTREAWLTGDLAAGRIDAVFGDGMRLSFWLAGEEGRRCCAFAGGPYLAPEYLGHGLTIAVARDRPELIAAFDYALQEIEANGSFGELYLRYFPVGFY